MSRSSNRVRIHADKRCTGMVILGDSFYPGREAYSFVRDVAALAGARQLEMRFRPGRVFGGVAYFVLGLPLPVICLLV